LQDPSRAVPKPQKCVVAEVLDEVAVVGLADVVVTTAVVLRGTAKAVLAKAAIRTEMEECILAD